MKIKKLPLAITTFSDVRDESENHIYRYLKSIFQGKKDDFKDLAIDTLWDWNVHYPEIHISLNSGNLKG